MSDVFVESRSDLRKFLKRHLPDPPIASPTGAVRYCAKEYYDPAGHAEDLLDADPERLVAEQPDLEDWLAQFARPELDGVVVVNISIIKEIADEARRLAKAKRREAARQ